MDEFSPRYFSFRCARRHPLTGVATSLRLIASSMAMFAAPAATFAQPAADAAPLRLEAKIPLGAVRGRIDHMAVDLGRQRLFVAELGNDSVGIVDLKGRKTIHTITGFAEPQGVGYVPSTDTLYVANARDGSVRLFRGAEYAPAGRIDLGSDADNIRLDIAANRILVGYGDGALAVLAINQNKKIGDFALPAHPESFQIGRDGKQIFVNVPRVHAIAVLDAARGQVTAKWPLREGGNFPMALDNSTGRVLVVSRSPPKLGVHSDGDGSAIASSETCGDLDDLFVDAGRGRVYVSCGAGYIDVFDAKGGNYNRVSRIATVAGARTSYFVPELDVFLLAVRATAAEAAAIWVFRCVP